MPKKERTKRKIPEIDDEFGSWTVCGQSYPGKAPSYNRKVPCICVCGKRRDIYYMNLLTHKSRSCGCQKRSMLKAKWKERKKKASNVPLARVRGIDTERRIVSAEMQGCGGTRPLSRIKLLKGHKIPEINDVILVFRDGSKYYCMDPIELERETDLERNAEEQLVPGDMAMGDPEEGAGVGLRRGGMAILKADMMTGIVVNKIIGIVQTLGKRFSWDTNFYHKLIQTLSDKRNTIIDTRLSGSPRNSPLTLEMLKSIIDTSDGSISIDLTGFDDCDIKFKFAPQALQTRGANIKIENETPMGTSKWEMDGTTGKVAMESPLLVKVDAPFIQLNSLGLPTEKVLRIGDVVPGPNGGVIAGLGSNTVFIG